MKQMGRKCEIDSKDVLVYLSYAIITKDTENITKRQTIGEVSKKEW